MVFLGRAAKRHIPQKDRRRVPLALRDLRAFRLAKKKKGVGAGLWVLPRRGLV